MICSKEEYDELQAIVDHAGTGDTSIERLQWAMSAILLYENLPKYKQVRYVHAVIILAYDLGTARGEYRNGKED